MYNSGKIKTVNLLCRCPVLSVQIFKESHHVAQPHARCSPKLQPTPLHQYIRASTALGLTLLLAACGQGSAPAAGSGGQVARHPRAEVGVITVQLTDVGLVTELPGDWRLRACAGARQSRGHCAKAPVCRGQPGACRSGVVQIDASPYQAALASAQASVAKAEANLMQAAAQASASSR